MRRHLVVAARTAGESSRLLAVGTVFSSSSSPSTSYLTLPILSSSRRPSFTTDILSRSSSSLLNLTRLWNRSVHDYIRGTTSGATYKIPLSSPKIVGVCSSRGSRPYQEDATSVHAISLDSREILRSLEKISQRKGKAKASSGITRGSNGSKSTNEPVQWDPSKSGSSFLASQTAFFGIYDGHGGKEVSGFLRDNLYKTIESVSINQIEPAIQATISHGGYFRRWRGGALERFVPASVFAKGRGEGKSGGVGKEEENEGDVEQGEKDKDKERDQEKETQTVEPRSGSSKIGDLEGTTSTSTNEEKVMDLEERLTLAFLQTDKEIQDTIGERSERMGSTASVVLLNSLDEPAQPYWSSKRILISVAHCGDTRVLLCDRRNGRAIPLTDRHHAEARVEADRLRRMGAERIVADSFGETRWMGAIENTRGFGDFEYKPSGVTAEPEVNMTLIDGTQHAYLILVTDGLTSLLSDQELVDLARKSSDPTRAAKTIVHFGEDLGATDNVTCVVVPLAGWGQVGGEDTTEERREYRKRQAGMVSTRMQRM